MRYFLLLASLLFLSCDIDLSSQATRQVIKQCLIAQEEGYLTCQLRIIGQVPNISCLCKTVPLLETGP